MNTMPMTCRKIHQYLSMLHFQCENEHLKSKKYTAYDYVGELDFTLSGWRWPLLWNQKCICNICLQEVVHGFE